MPSASQPPITKTTPIEKQPDKPIYKQWWFGRIVGGLLGGAFIAIMLNLWGGFSYLDSFLACSTGLIAALLYFGNTERRFYRSARLAFLSALSTVMMNLAGRIKFKTDNLEVDLDFLSDYSWAIAIILLGLAAYLFYLDSSQGKK